MADNITIKDASGSNVVMRFKDVGGGVESSITIPGDATGAIAWGTAGVSNSNVMSVQGIASGTALPISGTVTATQATGSNLHVVVDSGTITTSGSNSYTHISTATTTNGIKSGAGTLVAIVINQAGTSSTATLFDNTTATGTTIGVLDCSSRIGDIQYSAAFSTGLSIITTGSPAPDITVVWR